MTQVWMCFVYCLPDIYHVLKAIAFSQACVLPPVSPSLLSGGLGDVPKQGSPLVWPEFNCNCLRRFSPRSTEQVCCDTNFSDIWLEFKHHLVDRSPWVHIYMRVENLIPFKGVFSWQSLSVINKLMINHKFLSWRPTISGAEYQQFLLASIATEGAEHPGYICSLPRGPHCPVALGNMCCSHWLGFVTDRIKLPHCFKSHVKPGTMI